MKTAVFLFATIVTVTLTYLLSTPFDPAPAMGPFLSPFTGFWQNSDAKGYLFQPELTDPKLKEPVNIYFDERRIPHIYAQNEHDLYFAQGFVTAQDRLWQMDFITRAAAGRISELIGPKGLDFDRTQRRLGLPFAAEQSLKLLESDPKSKELLQAYADGVNAYINSLQYKDYPVEYKLMGYKPEAWSQLKSALLLKFMANNLSGRDNDFEYTNVLNLFGPEVVNMLYPDHPDSIDPIIPKGTVFTCDTFDIDTPAYSIPKGLFASSPYDGSEVENLGSNNWAVSPDKSKTGHPILCNDPHLGLNLPSIWYEMQLTCPEVNAYGVTLPGSPNIIIGFNDQVAWGVTNAGRDVRDWYALQYGDPKHLTYMVDGEPLPFEYRVEEIKIKGQPSYIDSIRMSVFGIVTYDENFRQYDNDTPLALTWTAHEPSKEALTFYYLNRAQNYNDYIDALNYYQCPAQNFVFADKAGDIAIKQQGKFPVKFPGQGRFIQDGTKSVYLWQDFIPYDCNPHVKNPARGFVSSANQHPTDSTYPFYYNGSYEYDRNRRINNTLGQDKKFGPKDMMALQNDVYNMSAQDFLPFFISKMDVSNLSNSERIIYDSFTNWDYYNTVEATAPTAYTVFMEELKRLLWDEFDPEKGFTVPKDHFTGLFLMNHPDSELIDNKGTPKKETEEDIINMALQATAQRLDDWKKEHLRQDYPWGEYKNTTVAHWVPMLTPFNVDHVMVGGGKHIVSANSHSHGASWKMVVSLEDSIKAWGIYPGGQSGNPGSPYYANFIDDWAKGGRYPLEFFPKGTKPTEPAFTQTLNP